MFIRSVICLASFCGALGVYGSVGAQTAPNDPRVRDTPFESGAGNVSEGLIPKTGSDVNCSLTQDNFQNAVEQGASDPNAFVVNSVRVLAPEGGSELEQLDLINERLSKYIGFKTNLDGLKAIAVEAQCAIRSSGNLLSAVRVPAQTFDSDSADIELRLILGRISSVDYIFDGQKIPDDLSASLLTGSQKRAISRVKSRFSKLLDQNYESNADLERAVLLASRVPGIAVRPTLRKSDGGAEGAIALTVDIFEFDQFHGDVTLLNYSPESLGEWGPLLQLESRSLLAGGDNLVLSAYSSLDLESQRVFRGAYSAPIGDSDWIGSIYGSYGVSEPGDDLTDIGLETESVIFGADIRYPWKVGSRFQADIYAGVEKVSQDLTVLETDISEDRLSVGYLGVEGYYALPRVFSYYDLQIRQGANVFGASNSGDTNVSRIGANPSATVVRANLQSTTRVANGLELSTRISGQFSSDPLLAYEEFTVGNFTIGRGYEPGQLSGDSALGGAAEINFKNFDLGSGDGGLDISVQPYIFGDAVQVWNEDQFSENRFVFSYGAGLKLEVAENVVTDVVYAQAERRVFSFSEEAPGGSILVRTSLKF